MFTVGFLAGVVYRRLAELELPPWDAALFIIAGIVLAYFFPDEDNHSIPRW